MSRQSRKVCDIRLSEIVLSEIIALILAKIVALWGRCSRFGPLDAPESMQSLITRPSLIPRGLSCAISDRFYSKNSLLACLITLSRLSCLSAQRKNDRLGASLRPAFFHTKKRIPRVFIVLAHFLLSARTLLTWAHLCAATCARLSCGCLNKFTRVQTLSCRKRSIQ